MSRNLRNNKDSYGKHFAESRGRRRASGFRGLPRFAVIAALAVLVVLGMISVSFGLIFNGSADPAPEGTLLHEIQTRLAANDDSNTGEKDDSAPLSSDKKDLAAAGAEADIARTGGTITNLTYVKFHADLSGYTGDGTAMSTWSNQPLTTTDNNHYYGTFYTASGQTEKNFGWNAGGSNWGDNWYTMNGQHFTAQQTVQKDLAFTQNGSNDKVSTIAATSGWVKLQVDWYGAYGSDSSVKFYQTAVSAISSSVSVGNATRQAGQTTTVTPSSSGGTGTPTNSITVRQGSASGTDVTSSVMSGSTFTAPNVATETVYYITNTATDPTIGSYSVTSSPVTITVTPAETTYTVSVNSANTSQGTVASASVSAGATAVTLPTATPKFGYKFKNWTTSSAGITITNPTSASAATVSATAAGTVTANWEADMSLNIYIVGRFGYRPTSGGSWVYTGSNEGDWNADSTNIKMTATATDFVYKLETNASLAEVSAKKNNLYQYFHIKSGTNEFYPSSDTVMSTTGTTLGTTGSNNMYFNSTSTDSPVTIYFNTATKKIWYDIPEFHNITVNTATGGTITASATRAEVGTEITLTVSPNTGYQLASLTVKDASNNNVTVTNNKFILPTSDVTVTPVFEKIQYTVTLDKNANDAVAGTASVNATYGDAMPSATMPTRTGYTFKGFYDTSASSGGTQYYTAAGASARAWNKTSNTTLYARWTAKTSALTFNANGGTGNMTTGLTATYGSAMPTASDKPAIPTKTGYTFQGFFDAASGGTKYYNADGASARTWDKDVTTGTTLYAQWTINQYTVTLLPVYREGSETYSIDFDVSGSVANSTPLNSSNSYTAEFDYGTSVQLVAGTTPSGYTFNGIYTDRTGSNRQNSPYTFTLSDDVTYYACYTRNLDVTLTLNATNMSGANATNLSEITLTAAVTGGTGGNTLTYSYKKDSGSWVTLSGTTFSPTLAGTYTFKAEVTDSVGSTASAEQTITVVRHPSTFTITNTPQSGSAAATISWTAIDTSVSPAAETTNATGGRFGDGLRLSFARPASDYYISSVTVTMGGVQIYSASNVNGNLSLTESDLTSRVSGNIVLSYLILEKPKVTVTNSAHIESHSMTYNIDGTSTTVTAPGDYYVDYGSGISYTAAPEEGYYISSVTPSGFGYVPVSGSFTGSLLSITADTTVTATAHDNPTVWVVQPEYGSVYLTSGTGENTIYYFNGDRAEYGTALSVHVFTNLGSSNTKYDGTHQYYTLGNVTATVGNTTTNLAAPVSNVTTHTIVDNTIYSAEVSYGDVSNPIDDTITAVAKNNRRILFLDNKGWGGANKDELYVHYSNVTTDNYYIAHDVEGENDPVILHNVQMQPLYVAAGSKTVYYADIPASYKYVSFNNGMENPTHSGDYYTAEIYSEYSTVTLTYNAFSSDSGTNGTNPRTMSDNWNSAYADYRTVGSAGTGTGVDAQQASTALNKAAVFHAKYDYSANDLTFTVIAGSSCNVSFSNGTLRITPTSNAYQYSLVKVSSNTSGVEKYYLVRIKPFELKSFEGLQRLYETSYLLTNNSALSLKTIARGNSPTFTYSYSPSNAQNSYTAFAETPATDPNPVSISGVDFLRNQLEIMYANYNYYGVEYFKVDVAETGASGESDSALQKAVFDVDNSSGSSVLYLRNDTMANLGDYHVVAKFSDGLNEEWLTMQQVGGDSDFYRTTVPAGMTALRIYLMYQDKYSADSTDVDALSDGEPVYYFASSPSLSVSANRTFTISEISEGAEGIAGSYGVFNN